MSPQRSKLLGTYHLDGCHHRIELIARDGGRKLLVDRPNDIAGGPIGVIAELDPDEGERQARALLHGAGAYLQRARRGERGLCRPLGDGHDQAPLRHAA